MAITPNSPLVTPQWLVDIEAVRRSQHQPGCLLIDSRAPERYRGSWLTTGRAWRAARGWFTVARG
jgi:3-mercaptopyruvate sulfurtransferase SseA